jgi:hypothetical protein
VKLSHNEMKGKIIKGKYVFRLEAQTYLRVKNSLENTQSEIIRERSAGQAEKITEDMQG